MKELEFRTGYWHEPNLKKAFMKFINDIFELDFGLWDYHGFWDDDFRPFTFFKDGKVISSVCLYSLRCIINGEKKRVAQLSSVGTLPEYRNKGLNKELSAIAIDWDRDTHEMIFLYTSEMAHGYYQKCGFTKYPEYTEVKKVPPVKKSPRVNLQKIGVERLGWIYERVTKRDPVSNKFSSLSEKLMMFHIIYKLHDKLYLLEDLGVILVMEIVDQSLVVYDIIGSSIPEHSQLEPYFLSFKVKKVLFRFHTDRLNIMDILLNKPVESNLYIYEPQTILRDLIFPYTIQA
ncbi:GNAT family N-acetyltransferase [Bacteroidota bacterium]